MTFKDNLLADDLLQVSNNIPILQNPASNDLWGINYVPWKPRELTETNQPLPSPQGEVYVSEGTLSDSTGADEHKHSSRPMGYSPYYFNGSMPEDVMHRYLDRAITLSEMYKEDGTGGPTATELIQLQAMVEKVGAKMCMHMVDYWSNVADWYINQTCDNLKGYIDYMHANVDDEIIFRGNLSENIPFDNEFNSVDIRLSNRVTVPPHLFPMFYGGAVDRGSVRVTPAVDVGVTDFSFFGAHHPEISGDPAYFDFVLMRYDKIRHADGTWDYPHNITYNSAADEINFDITKPESQMWYYYIATKFIDAGCEAIHMGDIGLLNKMDPGNWAYWGLLQKIRDYAARNARRGVVLLDAHCFHPDDIDKTADGGGLRDIYASTYYDPFPLSPNPNWNRKLLHDYLSLGVYYKRFTRSRMPCSGHVYDNFGNNYLPVTIESYHGLVNTSPGGYNYQGWYCAHSPYICMFDDGAIEPDSGCGASLPAPGWPDCWGYDNTSWFVNQMTDPIDIKTSVLVYNYYRIKCLDPSGHFEMPGRLIYSGNNSGNNLFYITSDWHSTVIKDIWDGVFASPNGWAYNNFTENSVSNWADDVLMRSDLIFVGDDKIFFIGIDSYIHGYIKINNGYNEGTWLTMSPSYGADGAFGSSDSSQKIGHQHPALCSLVANPDGNMLLYIGKDGGIHGFNIHDAWTYSYFSLPLDPHVMARSSLIFPTNKAIYYIGLNVNGEHQVNGFEYAGGNWYANSPWYLTTNLAHITDQVQAFIAPTFSVTGTGAVINAPHSGLVYDSVSTPNRIFYINKNLNISYYDVTDIHNYVYHDEHLLPIVGIRIAGNLALYSTTSETRIYFAGNRDSDGLQTCIFVLIYDSAGWNIQSLSNNAQIPQISQPSANKSGMIAVSPLGDTVAFVTDRNEVNLFTVSWPYIFNTNALKSPNTASVAISSLQFTSDTDLWHATVNYSSIGFLSHFIYGVDNCNNNIFNIYPV